MANIKSAKKRIKTSEEKRQANRTVKSRAISARTKLYKAIEDGNQGPAGTLYKEYCSALDKAAKKGIIKPNTVSRRKSRAAKRMAAASA